MPVVHTERNYMTSSGKLAASKLKKKNGRSKSKTVGFATLEALTSVRKVCLFEASHSGDSPDLFVGGGYA